MKKVISILCVLSLVTAGAWAQVQPSRRGGDNGWRERIRAEKVAFLTEQIDLTESEAQVFWPVYNQIQKDQRESFEASRLAYEALEKGIKDGKTGKEMENLVKAYIEAKDREDGVETKAYSKLSKVLPAEKVARYFIAEERFRHQQIGRLGGGSAPYLRMSEEQKQMWKERGGQMWEPFRGWSGQKTDKADTPAES